MPNPVQYLTISLLAAAQAMAQSSPELRVGVAGGEPFVVHVGGLRKGISVEIWDEVAKRAKWRYEFTDYASVPEAMNALHHGELDLAIGPVSITAERAEYALFSQPYFSSYLAILSRTEAPTPWQQKHHYHQRPHWCWQQWPAASSITACCQQRSRSLASCIK